MPGSACVKCGSGVPETGSIIILCLVSGSYEARERSMVLPALDIVQLSRFVRPGENQTALAKAYQAELRR